jgi:hypothetical protein
MKIERRKKCLGCQKWFTPDPRSQDRQRFCSKAACKKASKAWRQARWLAKPENQGYWSSAERKQKVKFWREKHPGYWRNHKRKGQLRYKTT